MHVIEIQFSTTSPGKAPPAPPMQLSVPSRQLRVRELIAAAVREQCAQLHLQHAVSQSEAALRVARQYLTDGEVAQLAQKGRVALGAAASAGVPEAVDVETQAAWQAFAGARFLLVVGDQRLADLDATVTLGLDTPVRFVRLVPLQGG